MPNVYEPLVLEIEPPYIGSAFSPTVDITETSDDVTVTITDSRGDHSYTIEKPAFDETTASIDANVGTPSVVVTASGSVGERDLHFAFSNLKGETGATGPQGPQGETGATGAAAGFGAVTATVDNAVGTPSVEVTTSGADTEKNFAFAFHNLKGEQGEPGEVQADGVYHDLGAGTADALYSTDETVDTFAQRVSDHDGACKIVSLRGNTVRWNQLYRITANQTYTESGITITRKTDGTLTLSGTTDVNVNVADLGTANVAGHKYLIRGHGDSTDAALSSQSFGFDDRNTGIIITNTATNATWYYTVYIKAGTTLSNFKMRPQIFDLTAMFGAGNEPQSVEEFERMFPESYYPYDAGSLLSVNIEGIESAGVTREIPASTYFPDGMRGIRGRNDELTEDAVITRFVKKTVSYLGNVYTGSGAIKFYRGVGFANGWQNGENWSSATDAAADAPYGNCVASDLLGFVDKTAPIYLGRTWNNLYVYTDTLTSQSDFEAATTALIGTNVIMPIPTTETTIDPPLNLSYPTEQGGTESIVIPTGEQSAAPTMAVVYAYNADGIVDKSQSIVAPVESGATSANYGVGSYFVMAGKLYRVTTAIATGETIRPGTNCLQTTVMAELVALTA